MYECTVVRRVTRLAGVHGSLSVYVMYGNSPHSTANQHSAYYVILWTPIKACSPRPGHQNVLSASAYTLSCDVFASEFCCPNSYVGLLKEKKTKQKQHDAGGSEFQPYESAIAAGDAEDGFGP